MLGRVLSLASVVAAVALWLCGTASAGTYTVYACQGPSGQPAPPTGFTVSYLGDGSYESGCKEIGLNTNVTHTHNQGADLTFDAPANTTIQGYTIWRAARVQPATTYDFSYEIFQGAGSDQRTLVDSCYGLNGCSGVGDTRQPLADGNRFTLDGLTNIRQVQLRVRCLLLASGGSPTCPATAPNPGSILDVYRADFTLRDDALPVLASQPTGSLVSGGLVSGVADVSLSASDLGGGVYQALFEVDGTVVQTSALGNCAPPFTALVPCPPSVSTTLNFDTSGLADGAHRLRILITDATGTNAAVFGPVVVRTMNAACGLPVTGDRSLRMAASLASKRTRKTRTVRYGRTVRVFGRLTTAAGAPVPGAPVCVGSHDDATGAGMGVLGMATTDAQGRFVTRVRALSSRSVRLAFRSSAGLVAASSVRLSVPAVVSIRASHHRLHRGQRVVLRGRVRGRAIPAQGLLVELQARRPGSWQTFRTARTDRRGRFTSTYRFTRTVGKVRYRLRARVPRQPVFAYAAGVARPVTITVRG